MTSLFSVVMYRGDDTQVLKITKVVTTMVTKRPCIPVTQINGISGMTYIQIDIHTLILLRYSLWYSNEISITLNNAEALLNINYKTQYGNHYGDKETMC